MIKNINFTLLAIFFYLFFTNYSAANFKEKLINKYKIINTLHFSFTQKIGDKFEYGNCYIKYPLLMKCEYLKKKKSIISNGKRFAVVKKKYKKVYDYNLKKTPLFFLLNKDTILNLIINYEPTRIGTDRIEYELVDNNSNKVKVFFDKNSLDLAGWKTTDAYSNEVLFFIRSIKTNILIKNEFFKIPKEEDL